MKNGQLMGSPLSFPILCAINFVPYKTALRRYIKAKGEMVAPPSKASTVAAYWKAQAEAGMATSSHGPVVPHGAPLTETKRRSWLFQMTFCSNSILSFTTNIGNHGGRNWLHFKSGQELYRSAILDHE